MIWKTITIIRPLIPSTVEIILDLGDHKSYTTADSTAIHQILVNLYTNGWQAMEDNGGKLTIELKNTLGINGFLEISVTDTGIGIDNDTKSHMFEPFFSTKINRSSSGTHYDRIWDTGTKREETHA